MKFWGNSVFVIMHETFACSPKMRLLDFINICRIGVGGNNTQSHKTLSLRMVLSLYIMHIRYNNKSCRRRYVCRHVGCLAQSCALRRCGVAIMLTEHRTINKRTDGTLAFDKHSRICQHTHTKQAHNIQQYVHGHRCVWRSSSPNGLFVIHDKLVIV